MFLFLGLIGGGGGGKKGKRGARGQKNFLAFPISGTIYHMIFIYGTPVYNDDISRYFFHFSKILMLWVVRGGRGWGKRAKNGPKSEKILSVT